ncbi:MAG TPA: GH116 family glycosyl-hydrolase [Candidatus Limnocylindrales bacterium]|nr:GH116 family glycosyl-hydrolase [Candidatus Limnocylindrales bacterium]
MKPLRDQTRIAASKRKQPCGTHCGCAGHGVGTGSPRREFLKLAGLSAGALAMQPWRAFAGPFERADFEQLVPADKKLRPEWIKSLTARGERTTYRGADLEKIGMPIGGICAGQVYLGGDGRLWHWDIFNQRVSTAADHYAKPLVPSGPSPQGFALSINSAGKKLVKPLDAAHWRDTSFTGEYPIGYVEYRDPEIPVTVNLEAFSPFTPLNVEDSSLPVTILQFTAQNHGPAALEVEIAGWLENAVCPVSSQNREGYHRNRLVRQPRFLLLECSAEAPPPRAPSSRPDITFDDFEHETYGSWTTTGTAFGSGPIEMAKVPDYQGALGGNGKRVVNTHATAPGTTVEARDSATGTLTSVPFVIERDYITFLIGGGAHKGKTCINLIIDERTVLSATGRDNNRMQPCTWDVRRWAGKTARLRIIDNESGPWGNIGIDDIVFSDQPHQPLGPLASEPDFGTLGLALLKPTAHDLVKTMLPHETVPSGLFSSGPSSRDPARRPFGEKLVGALGRTMKLAPGATDRATFLMTWHMPNLKLDRLPPGRHYATRFDSVHSLTVYIVENLQRLITQTQLWHNTWYDSTLPYWFLDRTFLNTSILATSTCYRLGNGRFYAWEGVGCCEGTCGHVWQYAHAPSRLFPELERITREQVDFGLAQQPDGSIHFRGEFNDFPAIDAQAGTILRVLREHQMSTDGSFLKSIWPKVKKATEWLITKDDNGDGLIESNQHNTLDTDWFGPVAWLSGLYLAALLAAKTMALELGDETFASRCNGILECGRQNLVSRLFDREYFVNRPDPNHADSINSGSGCEIDQVFGQSWAFQVGLPRLLPEKETRSALASLWRYNFTPDVGPYRKVYKPGRWYAMPGEAGLLMCTFPRADWNYSQAKGKGPDWAAGYFNECMNGFEYQVAGHMIWEGMLTEGLAVTRAVHDRYHASRRNPWNEVECGDHYARSMASYGVFLAACGFAYHGPKRHLGFQPRVFDPESPNHFRCAFATAEGWGSYEEKSDAGRKNAQVTVKYGKLRLRTLELAGADSSAVSLAEAKLNGRSISLKHSQTERRVRITFDEELEISAPQNLEVTIA